MKISSKSILSPNHTRDAPISLSTSLSRRLKTNRSLKGAQSPMFPTGGKKRFENPEPSSPKVTCIGQVRVKTKKQGKKIRTLSSIRGNEVSFRRVEQIREVGNPNQTQNFQAKSQRNQRWVHIPLTICEALRGIGADFSCLFACRSSCSSTGTEREIERERERKLTESREGSGGGSCAAVFARWLVAGREIELVVGGEGERVGSGERSLRRHVEEEIEIRDEECEVSRVGVGEEEEGRVSICVPPKNALLLMRCKSDPMRVSALVNRFWESPDRRGEEEDEDEDEEDDHDEEEHGNIEAEVLKPHEEVEVSEKLGSSEATDEYNPEAEMHLVMEVEKAEEKKNPEEELDLNEELQEQEEEEEEEEEKQELVAQEAEAEEIEASCSLSEAEIDPDGLEIETIAMKLIQVREEEEEDGEARRKSYQSSSLVSVHSDSEEAERSTEEKETHETILEDVFESEESHKGGESMESEEREIEVKKKNQEREGSESEETQKEEGMESEEREINEKVEREIEVKKNQERERGSVLPDCLLLMMCEPKLSMEVSKETWVCSTDFIRWLPERKPVKKINGGDLRKKRSSVDPNPLPPRSSCSLPAVAPAVSMAAMIEQKLVNAAAYEPFVLTRCKSEPMRTAAAKLAPETCFWKNRKLEPHRRATFGFGAAGVGF